MELESEAMVDRRRSRIGQAGGEQRNSSGRRMSYDKSFSFAIGHGHEEIVNLSSHDEFPLLDTDDYTPHLSPRTTLGHEASTLSSSVKKPGPEEACYPVWEGMKLLLIFNFSIIEGKEERTGSYRDVENLKRTFQDKNFEVTVFEDLTKSDVEKVLEKYRTNQDLKKISALFMIFMSHGDGKNPESFLSYDGQSINMAKDVRFFFNDENCHLLKGKPKVFHGIFCRDITDKEDTHLSSNYDESTSKLKYFNDMMTIYSCARGKKSYRDGTNGTYLVFHS
ncbi:Caspase-like domain [Trinorchestia longiramus]|nr:Caspase-like domain [Trinorchestia longiramus]